MPTPLERHGIHLLMSGLSLILSACVSTAILLLIIEDPKLLNAKIYSSIATAAVISVAHYLTLRLLERDNFRKTLVGQLCRDLSTYGQFTLLFTGSFQIFTIGKDSYATMKPAYQKLYKPSENRISANWFFYTRNGEPRVKIDGKAVDISTVLSQHELMMLTDITPAPALVRWVRSKYELLMFF